MALQMAKLSLLKVGWDLEYGAFQRLAGPSQCPESSQGDDQMGIVGVPQRETKDSNRLTRKYLHKDLDPALGPNLYLVLESDPDLDPSLNLGPDLNLASSSDSYLD